MKTKTVESGQLDNIIFLRGIAVLVVCFCHFGFPLSMNNYFAGVFQFFHNYGGYFGIHMFFVISGFIIPFSLWKGKYIQKDYLRFLYKRVLRLHPPYIAALAITLVIMFFSYKVRRVPFPESTLSIIKSLFYFHIPFDNPVFWTLAVEAQYYLFIGLLFVPIMRYPKVMVTFGFLMLILAGNFFLSSSMNFFSYISTFLLGILTFLVYLDYEKGRNIYFLMIALLIVFSFFEHSTVIVLAIVTSVFGILLLKDVSFSSYMLFPGKISYSIYLIHFPLGIKAINLLKPTIAPSYYWLLFILVLAFVIFTSWLFYLCFEEFSERLSRRIKYKMKRIKEAV